VSVGFSGSFVVMVMVFVNFPWTAPALIEKGNSPDSPGASFCG